MTTIEKTDEIIKVLELVTNHLRPIASILDARKRVNELIFAVDTQAPPTTFNEMMAKEYKVLVERVDKLEHELSAGISRAACNNYNSHKTLAGQRELDPTPKPPDTSFDKTIPTSVRRDMEVYHIWESYAWYGLFKKGVTEAAKKVGLDERQIRQILRRYMDMD
jgi:hypothetical protein